MQPNWTSADGWIDSVVATEGKSGIHALDLCVQEEIRPHAHEKAERVDRSNLFGGAGRRVLEIHEHAISHLLLFAAAGVDRHLSSPSSRWAGLRAVSAHKQQTLSGQG